MRKVLLGEVCEITMGQAPSGDSYNLEGFGCPLIAGAGDFGQDKPQPKKFTTAAGKISKLNDIILCIRATIGDLNWSDKEYCLGRGVSGLRPKHGILDRYYLWHWLRANYKELARKGKGSTFKQVSRSDIEEMLISLPENIEEQRRIAAILDKANSIRRKREQSLALADDLLRATFLDMFGDPVTNPKGWEEVPISDFGNLERGKSKHRPRNDPKLLGGPYPLIQTGDVANADFTISSYNQTYSEMGLRQSRMWPKGTLCVTIAANIADTAVLGFDACFPDSVVGFFPKNQKHQSYVQGLFGFLKKIIEERAPQSAQKNINLEILRALTVQRPSIELMEEYNSAVGKTLKLKNRIKSAANAEKYLFASLSQRAFRGEL